MQHDDLVYVGQMLDLARKIEARRHRLNREAFDGDEDLRLALAHLIQTLGEAARHVSDAFRAEHPRIPWTAIVGMRHKIVHDYLSVDFDLVWDVSTLDVPAVLPELARIVGES